MQTAEKLITENLDIWSSAVKAKSSAGRGSNNKRELYGVQKLRELILDLAVRGLLVPQDPNDEPASELLKQIDSERHRLAKAGIFKKPKPLVAVAQNETPFELPEGWAFTRNGALFGLKKGKVPKDLSESEGSIPYLDIEALDRGNIRRHTNDDKAPKSTEEDILVVCDGSRSGLVLDGKNGAIGSTLSVIETPLIIQGYVKLVFLQAYQRLNSTMKGAAIPHLDTKQLLIDIIGLPPLAEQHRIVAKVDELMALCDQLEKEQESSLDTHDTLVATLLGALTTATADAGQFAEAWHRIQANFDTLFTTESSIDQLKQTILQLAVMGKLVEQDPDDESAATSLERIATHRAGLIKAGDLKKRKLLPPIPKDEEPSKLPDPWQWCQLDVLITDMDAGWSPACPPTPSPSHDIWGVLKTTAVQVMEYRESENKVLDGGKSPRPQYEVKTGDILITRAGPKNRVGISCLVENTRPRLMISDKIIRFHLVEVGFSERFISLCLNAGPTWDYLESAKSGMAESQMNISQGKLRAAPIPLPPLAEQHRIVAKVEELMALCNQLKGSLATAQATQINLADSLVEQAIA